MASLGLYLERRPSGWRRRILLGLDLQRAFQFSAIRTRARTICCSRTRSGRMPLSIFAGPCRPRSGTASKQPPGASHQSVLVTFTGDPSCSMHPASASRPSPSCSGYSLAVVSVAGMIQDYRKRQLALEPLRIAIEHGQQLSPEIIAKLLGREERHEGARSTTAAGRRHHYLRRRSRSRPAVHLHRAGLSALSLDRPRCRRPGGVRWCWTDHCREESAAVTRDAVPERVASGQTS